MRGYSADDLYSLATLSLLLHGIALPLCLRIHALYDPTSYSETPWLFARPALDGLSGLAILTNLTVIDHLVCYLHGFHASDSVFQVMERKLSQLCRVINRLVRISRFRLCLLGTLAPQFGCTIPDKDLQIWTTSIGGLLNTVIDRGCTELAVHSGCWSEDPYRFHSVNPSREPLNTFGYFLRSLFVNSWSSGTSLRDLNWEFRRPQERSFSRSIVMHASPESLATSALCSFIIQSRIFLISPYLNWTLSVLYLGANITSFTFRLTQLNSEIWAIILTRVAEVVSGRLKEVYFQSRCYGLRFSTLLEFLSKTPNLTHLEVHGACKLRIADPCTADSFTSHNCSLVVPHLPNLQVLIAPFCVTSHLLSSSDALNISPLPSLRKWVIFFKGEKLLGNYAYLEDCRHKHTIIRERLSCGNSESQINHPKFSAHILGHPYSYHMPLFPDEDKFVVAEDTGTLPRFTDITRVIYDHMPTRQQLLEGAESFLRAVNL